MKGSLPDFICFFETPFPSHCERHMCMLPKVHTPGEIGARKAIKEVSFAKADFARHEHTPVIVFGIAKIRRTRLTAVISGLKLEGEIKELQV